MQRRRRAPRTDARAIMMMKYSFSFLSSQSGAGVVVVASGVGVVVSGEEVVVVVSGGGGVTLVRTFILTTASVLLPSSVLFSCA